MKKILLSFLVVSAFALGTQQPARADGVSFGIPLPFPFAFYNFGGPGYSRPYYTGYYPRPYFRAYWYRRPYWGGPPRYWGGYYRRYWGPRCWR